MNILKDGDIIEGSIKGESCTGVLSIENNHMYFCQDKYMGSPCKNKYGFKNSWIFEYDLVNGFTDNVIIFTVNNKDINIESISVSFRDKRVIFFHNINNKGIMTKKKEIKICNFKYHPDCCGSLTLFDFDKSEEMKYSRYNDIFNNKKYLDALKSSFRIQEKRDKIIHLASYQIIAIKLVEAIGFKKLTEYKNPNSTNMINIYNYI